MGKYTLEFYSLMALGLILVLIQSVAGDLSTNEHLVSMPSSQSATAKGGLEVKITSEGIINVTVVKKAEDTSTKCYLHTNSTNITSALISGSFISNNCVLATNLTQYENYIFLVDKEGATYTQYYGTPSGFPITDTDLIWLSTVLQGGTTFDRYPTYSFSIEKLIVGFQDAGGNQTPTGLNDSYYLNQTMVLLNQTVLRVDALEEENKMIWIVALYIFFTLFGYHLLSRWSLIPGYAMLLMSLFFDFFLVAYLYENYVSVLSGESIPTMLYGIFGLGVLFWMAIKLIFVLSIGAKKELNKG